MAWIGIYFIIAYLAVQKMPVLAFLLWLCVFFALEDLKDDEIGVE